MNADAYIGPQPPPSHDYTVSGSDFGENAKYQYLAVGLALLLSSEFTIWPAVVFARGVETHRRDAPAAASVHDAEMTTTSIDGLGSVPHYVVDNEQVFPVYGWLDVKWQAPRSD